MAWLTYGVPAAAAGLGIISLVSVWLLSVRFHRHHPDHHASQNGNPARH